MSRDILSHAAWSAEKFPVSSVVQEPPLGTADAVRVAMPVIGTVDLLLVLFADHPLLTGATVEKLVNSARSTSALVTVLTCGATDAGSYGRVERDNAGNVVRIVERRDDDPDLRRGPVEINSGMMVIDARWAGEALARIEPSPVSGEFYLPELVRLAVAEAAIGQRWPVQTVEGEPSDLVGVNDRVELAEADRIMRERIRRRHMLAGVSIVLPETVVIDADVEIGVDTTILPFSVLETGTRIGARCLVGPHTVLARTTLADDVVVRSSTLTDTHVAAGADAGPYAHLRGGTRLGRGVHVGNFAELKNSEIDAGTMIGHFSYIGDATVGARSNIGAGTVTCNFDGVDKHRTVIGADVFVGSDTMLVAPITLGDGARTGAGSVVTKDVKAGATVVGVPARAIRRRGAEQAVNEHGDARKDEADR